jgi:TIMELESS-interacting protein
MAAAAASATGCTKCGRPGHWSSDCPSQPASENGRAPGAASAAAPSSAGNAAVGTQGGAQRYAQGGGTQRHTQGGAQGYKRKEPWGGRSGSFVPREKPVKAVVPPRRMPKLTPDLLLGPDGLGYVLEKIPRQVTIKGHGHEVEDLKSLLEAYVRWHQTLLPYYSYSQFVEKVEKVGSTKRVRVWLSFYYAVCSLPCVESLSSSYIHVMVA